MIATAIPSLELQFPGIDSNFSWRWCLSTTWKRGRNGGNTIDSQPLGRNWASLMTPDDFLTIDESLYPVRTHVSIKQYNKNKLWHTLSLNKCCQISVHISLNTVQWEAKRGAYRRLCNGNRGTRQAHGKPPTIACTVERKESQHRPLLYCSYLGRVAVRGSRHDNDRDVANKTRRVYLLH